ncbi:MAG: hypothetical protein IT201_10265 [Thermoleophilia bacterium]|nr:hypothetical protein [Thermoleophilia bacterium]
MADRDRTDADSDIEFDFFDEPPTIERSPGVEPAPRPREGGGGGGTPPIRPRSPGPSTPLVRLALLIGGAIVLAVVLVFWVNSCRGGQKKGSYEDYLQAVAAVVRESDSVGAQLGELLTTPGVTLADLEAGLAGLAKQQAQVVARAGELTPPGPLVAEQESLVEAMQLRQSGLAGLERAFAQLQPATAAETAGTTLAEQAFRIVAGNVVYDDLFKGRSEAVMKQEEISGVAVPASTFLDSPELLSQNSLAELVKRTQGGGGDETGVLHGNQIEGVLVQPDGQALSPDQETTIITSDQLAFEVQVKNSGDFQETKVKVTLTITSPEPIKRQATIDLINAGETKSVTFRDFSNIDFNRPYTLKVAVKPVQGEENTTNNTAEYPVIFSLE